MGQCIRKEKSKKKKTKIIYNYENISEDEILRVNNLEPCLKPDDDEQDQIDNLKAKGIETIAHNNNNEPKIERNNSFEYQQVTVNCSKYIDLMSMLDSIDAENAEYINTKENKPSYDIIDISDEESICGVGVEPDEDDVNEDDGNENLECSKEKEQTMLLINNENPLKEILEDSQQTPIVEASGDHAETKKKCRYEEVMKTFKPDDDTELLNKCATVKRPTIFLYRPNQYNHTDHKRGLGDSIMTSRTTEHHNKKQESPPVIVVTEKSSKTCCNIKPATKTVQQTKLQVKTKDTKKDQQNLKKFYLNSIKLNNKTHDLGGVGDIPSKLYNKQTKSKALKSAKTKPLTNNQKLKQQQQRLDYDFLKFHGDLLKDKHFKYTSDYTHDILKYPLAKNYINNLNTNDSGDVGDVITNGDESPSPVNES